MRVQFLVNLGSRDADSLGKLDISKCMAGRTLDVPDDIAEKLEKRGIAKALKVQATPVRPPVAEPEEKSSGKK